MADLMRQDDFDRGGTPQYLSPWPLLQAESQRHGCGFVDD